MLRKVLLGIAALIIILVGIIYTRGSTFRVERATRIEAPPDVVYALVSDFRAWDRWSPWAHLDPSMKVTYGGTPSAIGSTMSWTGNDKVGEGSMRITETKPPQALAMRLEFIKPMASVNRSDFTFKPDGTGTKVDWVMTGPLDFMGKGMDLFVGMDRMIGPDFEKGLASMRREAEADAKKRAEAATASATQAAPTPAEPAPAAPAK
ncbi:MAG TPA: SRPBCC family protein [Myxococcaceae bacterium]|nr:SRPBCC family protein [Myxococcaceae bacterium]